MSYQIRTVWGPTGAQKLLTRLTERARVISEEERQRAGKYLSSASYGTPVPIAIGQIRVPAPLIGWWPSLKRALYLAAEGEVVLGSVAYNNGSAVPIAQDPAQYVPGTDTQDIPWNEDAQRPDYLGRAVAWRTLGEKDGDRPPSLSYEINGERIDPLQRAILHDIGPVGDNQAPAEYQADSLVRGEEIHACWVQMFAGTWRINYARSTDQGITWSAPTAAVSGIGHAYPTPKLSALPSGAMHIAYFAQNGTTVEVRDAYAVGAAWADRAVATITAAQRPGLVGGSHLSASAAGGRLWIAWQCDAGYSSRGIDVASTTADTGAATWARPPATYSLGSTGREYQLGMYGGYNQSMFLLRTPSIAASPDGSAALAFGSRVAIRAVYVRPIRVNAGQVQWSAGYGSGDPGGLSITALSGGKYYPVLWDANTEPALPGTGRHVRGSALHLVWLGSSGLAGFADSWALSYRYGPQPLTSYFGDGPAGPTSYLCRIGALTATAAQERELVLSSETLVQVPRAMALPDRVVLGAVPRRNMVYQSSVIWRGAEDAYRWEVTFPASGPSLARSRVYSALVSGGSPLNNGQSLEVSPTLSGLLVHEWGDFELGDGGTLQGKRSRLISWDPSIQALGDVDPSIILRQLVTNPRYGAWPAFEEFLGDTTNLDAYTQAMGFLFSDALTAQTGTWQHLVELMGSANCEPAWQGGKLHWIPLEPRTVSGNGATYTPKPEHAAPVYHLTDRDFRGTLRPGRRPVSQEKNVAPVTFRDRSRNYSTVPSEVRDPAGIALRNEQKASVVDCPWITRPSVANMSSYLRLRRGRMAPETWEFDLLPDYCRLEEGDLVTLTDAQVGLDHEVCRITKIVDHRNGSMAVTAENAGIEFSAPVCPIVSDDSLSEPIWYAPSILPPALVAMPASYTPSPRVVLAAVAGLPGWAGCDVYRSWDGEEWERIGEVLASSPVGVLSAPMGNLSPRPGLRPHPGLRPGLQDDWAGDFAIAQQTIPAPGAAYAVPRPPALALIGSELVAQWERANSAGWQSAGATLQRGAWGTTAQQAHNPGEIVAVFGGNSFAWTPDGSGTLYLRFPVRGWGGAMSQPLEMATTQTVEVPA